MSVFTSSGGAQTFTGSVTITGVASPLISNVLLTDANTEYSITLPNNCKRYLIKLRDPASLKLRYISGSDYLTIPPGCHYTEDDIETLSISIYVESTSPAQMIELVTWV